MRNTSRLLALLALTVCQVPALALMVGTDMASENDLLMPVALMVAFYVVSFAKLLSERPEGVDLLWRSLFAANAAYSLVLGGGLLFGPRGCISIGLADIAGVMLVTYGPVLGVRFLLRGKLITLELQEGVPGFER